MEGEAGEKSLVFPGVERGAAAERVIEGGGVPNNISGLGEPVLLVEGEPFPSLFGVGGLIVQGLDVEHDPLARLLFFDEAEDAGAVPLAPEGVVGRQIEHERGLLVADEVGKADEDTLIGEGKEVDPLRRLKSRRIQKGIFSTAGKAERNSLLTFFAFFETRQTLSSLSDSFMYLCLQISELTDNIWPNGRRFR